MRSILNEPARAGFLWGRGLVGEPPLEDLIDDRCLRSDLLGCPAVTSTYGCPTDGPVGARCPVLLLGNTPDLESLAGHRSGWLLRSIVTNGSVGCLRRSMREWNGRRLCGVWIVCHQGLRSSPATGSDSSGFRMIDRCWLGRSSLQLPPRSVPWWPPGP